MKYDVHLCVKLKRWFKFEYVHNFFNCDNQVKLKTVNDNNSKLNLFKNLQIKVIKH